MMRLGLMRGAGSLMFALACGTAAGLAVAANDPPGQAPPAVEEKQAPLRHGVFRFTSYPAAWTAAQKSNRPILVYVTSRSCPHCSRMLGNTYQRTAVKDFVCDSFETVYVDRNEQPELAAKLRVRRFPTTVVVGPDNKVIDMMEGYVDPTAFSRRLQTSLAAQSGETTTR